MNNWNEIENNYLISNYTDPKEYLTKETDIVINETVLDLIEWWNEKKKILKTQAIELLKTKKKSEVYQPSVDDLNDIYKDLINIYKAKTKSELQKIKVTEDWTIIIPPDLNMEDIDKIFAVVRTLRWEPTRISTAESNKTIIAKQQNNIIFNLPNNWREWQLEK